MALDPNHKLLKWLRRAGSGPLLSAVLGLSFFLLTFGGRVLNPRNILWLHSYDRAQHYLGWAFFRQAPWSLPLGRIPGFVEPLGASVAMTDAIPWLAVSMKAVEGILPAAWQYYGFWLASCFVLQGVFSFLLLKEFTEARLAVVGSVFFITSPCMLFRQMHMSLCAHWLIVAALWLYVRLQREPEASLAGRFTRCDGSRDALANPTSRGANDSAVRRERRHGPRDRMHPHHGGRGEFPAALPRNPRDLPHRSVTSLDTSAAVAKMLNVGRFFDRR